MQLERSSSSTSSSVREEVINRYPDREFLFLDGMDEAVLGVDTESFRVVYDKNKIIEVLMERHGMEETEALEYYSFNIEGAYLGEKTPLFVDKF